MYIFVLFTLAYTQINSNLHLHHVSSTETLLQFTIQNQDSIDFQEILQPQPLLGRSFLENLHHKANVRQLYISVTIGRLNPAIYDTLANAPRHGTVVIANADINQELAINQLSEIFRIVRHNLIHDPTYFIRMDNQQNSTFEPFGLDQIIQLPDEIYFAQDPTDHICIDAIEKLKSILGCKGESGILALIDQVRNIVQYYAKNRLFHSSYISLQGYFEYDEVNKIAKQKFVLMSQVNSTNMMNIFRNTKINACPQHNSALIKHSNQKHEFDLQQAQYMQASLLSRSSNETTLINYSEEIVMQRYLSGEWFNFETYLVHQIQTKVDGDLVISIYISKDYLPLFSTLEIKVFSGDRVIEKDNKTKLAFNEGVNLRISCRMQKDEVIWTRIKLKKKMNSFENYPHDPERGHDIISSTVFFNGRLYLSENQVTRLPAPDFSMPFNILTFTCLTIGYYFLQVLRLTIDKYELNKEEKGSIAQRLFRALFNMLFGNKNDKIKID